MAHVLVVDDDPDIRSLLVLALGDAGFAVREAADGSEALAELEAHAPDAVVLDVMMPVHDGFEVLRRMKARGLAPDAKVLLLTTKKSERDRVRGWAGGVDEFVTKPFDPVDLAARVRALLRAGDDELAARRTAERDRAELLLRLEAAFERVRREDSRPASAAAARLLRRDS